MDQEFKDKLNNLLTEFALLTAACEGNLHHEHTIINKAIYIKAVSIQEKLIELTN